MQFARTILIGALSASAKWPVLFASAFLLACGDPLPPGFQVGVAARVLTPTIGVDDTLKVRVVAINGMSHAVTVTSASTCHFYLYVYDATNQEVDRSRPTCGMAFTDLTIPAHDSVSQELALRIWAFDGSELVPPQPGNYTVRGTLAAVPNPVWSEPVPFRIE